MKKRILGLLIVANLALIWGNSLMPGEVSGAMSGGILEVLAELFPFLGTEAGHTLIRKLAHFSEFACLGVLTGWYFRLDRGRLSPALPGCGLMVACVDETIQIFVPGRASSLIDVWIDFSGYAAGLALLMLGYTIIKHKK